MHWKISDALMGHFLINSDTCLKRCFLSEPFCSSWIRYCHRNQETGICRASQWKLFPTIPCVHICQSNSQPHFWKQEFHTTSLIALTDQRNLTCYTAIFTGGTFCSWKSIGKQKLWHNKSPTWMPMAQCCQNTKRYFKCQNNTELIFYNCVPSPNKPPFLSLHTLQELFRKLTHCCCKPKSKRHIRFYTLVKYVPLQLKFQQFAVEVFPFQFLEASCHK